MVRLRQVVNWIESVAPLSLAETWDHVGLQIGDPFASVESVMTCLSLTPAVLEEALDLGVDCVVSHHPFLFRPLRSVDFSSPIGSMIRKICSSGISVYSCHTNYDKAANGLNYHLARMLGLQNTIPLICHPGEKGVGLGRVGTLAQDLGWDEYFEFVKQTLKADVVRVIRGSARNRTVCPQRIAVCGGSGGSLVEQAAAAADLYITGDLGYHDALYAQDLGIEIWDFGHFSTEIKAATWLADLIRRCASDAGVYIKVIVANSETDPIVAG